MGARDDPDSPLDPSTFTDIATEHEPFTITLNDKGLFKELAVHPNATLAERNLARAWASQLQMNVDMIKSGGRGFVSSEQSVDGLCDVTYVGSGGSVRKSVSHVDDCERRSFRFVDDCRTVTCDGGADKGGGWGRFPSSATSTVFDIDSDGEEE